MHSLPSNYKTAEDLENQAEYTLIKILQEIPFVKNEIEIGNKKLAPIFDFAAEISISGKKWTLVVAASNNGQPRLAKIKTEQWKVWQTNADLPNGYLLFVAPYVSESSRAICKAAGVGYFDLVGNCFLSFDHVFIERFGFRKEAEKRELRSVFHDKSSRVIRRLLTNPHHHWHVHELSRDAGVSMGLVSQVKTKLMDSQMLERRGEMFVVSRPEDLLKKWADAYRFKKNEQVEFYSGKPLPEVDRQLSDYCDRQGIQYAFTLFSAAGLIGAQYVRVANRSYTYVDADLHMIAKEIGLKEVSSGGNVILLKPFDDDLMYGKRKVENSWVVSDIQLFLDFSAQKGRAQETADFLLDTRVRQSWENQVNVSES